MTFEPNDRVIVAASRYEPGRIRDDGIYGTDKSGHEFTERVHPAFTGTVVRVEWGTARPRRQFYTVRDEAGREWTRFREELSLAPK
jgi:hypothetical protein